MARQTKADKDTEDLKGQIDPSKEIPGETLESDGPLIYAAMIAVMQEVQGIAKNQESGGTGNYKFNFRGIDDVMNALHPILSKHGVFVTPLVEHMENKVFVSETRNNSGVVTGTRNTYWTGLRVRYRFYAIDGSSVDCVVCAESSDNSDKATQQALSYCFKAAMLQPFCIPTKDTKDGDHKTDNIEGKEAQPTPPASSTKQTSRLEALPKLPPRTAPATADAPAETGPPTEKEAPAGEVKMTTNEAWKSIKDLLVPDLVKDDTNFHWWRIKTLRENGKEVPQNMGLVPREDGILLYKIAHASKEAGILLDRLPEVEGATTAAAT